MLTLNGNSRTHAEIIDTKAGGDHKIMLRHFSFQQDDAKCAACTGTRNNFLKVDFMEW